MKAAGEPPTLEALLAGSQNLLREKWDWSLPEPLLFKTYASLRLNLDEACGWVRSLRPDDAAGQIQSVGGDVRSTDEPEVFE